MIKEIESMIDPYLIQGYTEKLSKQLLIWHLEKQREMLEDINTQYDHGFFEAMINGLSEQIEELKK
jgi:hypothetical protein